MAGYKKGNEIPTIDVVLVTIDVKREDETGEYEEELALDTADQIGVEPSIETTDAITLIIKGKLKAQKRGTSTLTGNTITLRDNVFNPELVMILQGGKVTYDGDNPSLVTGYIPPVAGSSVDDLPIFRLNAYSAVYDASGIIQRYEKITYPNCTGQPIAMSSEDNVFRVSEYTIISAPSDGEAPYTIGYVDKLPDIVANDE